MKRKELKNLAIKVAEKELKLQSGELSHNEQKDIEKELVILCGKVTCLEDMVLLDDYVQEIIQKNKNI